ncbi:MAG: hypothetical protein AAGC77_06220 [Pseudomonadota bacterium]
MGDPTATGGAVGDTDTQNTIDPARAVAALQRWRARVAEAMGADPGGSLDQPDRKLMMLRAFGSTRRLSELCMTHPAAAATALLDGPSPILAEAARDLAALDRGVGGPEALHAALAPIKNRADVAIALAELGGVWTLADATAARVDFAERLVEVALQWLVRAAAKRGELPAEEDAAFMHGAFALASGDFAQEDLAPYGPLDLMVVYNPSAFDAAAARTAERVFVRIGQELRAAFEGRPGDYPLFALKTPMGSGVGGAGIVEDIARVKAAIAGPQSHALKCWLAGARVVAGDRTAGGAFLEELEQTIWEESPAANEEMRKEFEAESDDPRAYFRRIADLCRLAVGGARPMFRTASARQVFETAARSNALNEDVARRLIAGEELAHIVVSRAQMLRGFASIDVERDDERQALARLVGFSTYDELALVLRGSQMEARNTLLRLMRGAHEEVALYQGEEGDRQDADKLEDLGFSNGASVASAIDGWAERAGGDGEKRFAAHAPGLLTEFGETQYPNDAIRLFDTLLTRAQDDDAVFGLVREGAPQRSAVVEALGCFGKMVEPLTQSQEGAAAFLDINGMETPHTGPEWVLRYTPPVIDEASKLEDYAAWRRETIARVALSAASGGASFDAAARGLEAIHTRTLADVFELARKTAPKEEGRICDRIAVYIYDGVNGHLPGASTAIGFIGDKAAGEDGNAFVRRYLGMLDSLGEGVFAIAPDASRRAGGVSGPLAQEAGAFKDYVQTEAVAHDLIMMARARVIAGAPKISDKARDALRSAVSTGRRADVLFRDLDRARAQRMRREQAGSDWDLERFAGGLCDVELVVSALIYRHACAHPFVQEGDVAEALDAMARSSLIGGDAAHTLSAAHNFWSRLQTVRALSQWHDPLHAPVRRRFGALIARAAGVDGFEQVRPLMSGYADDVTRLYGQLILGRPTLTSTPASAAGA